MKKTNVVDYMNIPLEVEGADLKKKCFIVYSSREDHIEITIDAIETVLGFEDKFEVQRLAIDGIAGNSQYSQLLEFLDKCSMAVVVLDGLRPNVLFEYGILVGLGKPCIVLLEENATIDIKSFLKSDQPNEIPKTWIDVDKDFSDVKDRMYVSYKYNDPKKIRSIISEELIKISPQVEEAFLNVVFPEIKYIENEASASLQRMLELIKSKEKPTIDEEIDFKVCSREIERIAKKHQINLTKYFFYLKIDFLRKLEKYDDSLILIEELIATNKKDIQLLRKKFNILIIVGENDLAIDCINTAIEIAPKEEDLWHNKAILLEQMGKVEEAILCYEKGAEYNKSCPTIHYHLGVLLLDCDKAEEAIPQFDKAIAMSPSKSSYYVIKAICLKKLGRRDLAIAVVRDALSFDEKDYDAWYQLGKMTEDDNDSLIYFDKCLELNSQHPGALCSKGASLSNIGKFSEALEFLNAAISNCHRMDKGKGSCSTIEWNFARTKYQIYMTGSRDRGLVRESISHFEACLKDNKDEEEVRDVHNDLGYLYLSIGDFENAKQHLDEARNLNNPSSGNEAVNLYNLSLYNMLDGSFEEAKENLEQARTIIKDRGSDMLCYCLLYPEMKASGIVLTELNDSPSLIECFEKTEVVLGQVQ